MRRFLHDLIGLWSRLMTAGRRRRLVRDLDEELAFHVAMREAEYGRAGTPVPDAGQAARRRFGNLPALKEQCRDMWTLTSLEALWRDTRYAARTLRRSPGFTFVAVLALAIGIGATSAIFSLVDAIWIRGLPYPHPDRLVLLIGNVERAKVERRGASYPDYLDWRAQSKSFDDMAVYSPASVTLTVGNEPERLATEYVSAPYFSLLGVTPLHGRVFRADEDAVPDRDAVAVLGEGLWRRRFAADPSIVGKTVKIGAREFAIVGVLPAGFSGLNDQAQMWIPYVMSGALDNRGARSFQVLARLKPGLTASQAQTEMDGISLRLAKAYPQTNDKRGVEISPLSVETFGQLRNIAEALMVAVTFLLLIACANVAHLLIARSDLRQREIAVRSALGAGQARLVRQLVTESLVLSGLGAMAGLALAYTGMQLAVSHSPVTFPSFAQPHLSVSVTLFTIGLSVACGLLLGLAPAAHARSSGLSDVLKASARGSSGRSMRLRNALVVAEVSLAVLLLAGAGLMIRTVFKLTAIQPGFETNSVLILSVSIPRETVATPAVPPAPMAGTAAPAPPPPFVVSWRPMLERIAAIPGVEAAALASDTPLDGSGSAVFYAAEGDNTTSAQTVPRAYLHRVTPGFFTTLRMPLRAGRTFTPSELTADSTAVIVSHALVRRFWPGQDPIGKRIKFGTAASTNPWMSIVGMVDDVNYRALPANPTADPDLYLPYVDRAQQGLVLHTAVEPGSLAAPVRAALRELSPSVVVYNIGTMADRIDSRTSASKFTTWLMGVFAAVALLLSVVGVYGVMSYLVVQRRREFGIRLALGAARGEIVRLVMANGVRMIGLGLAIGLLGSIGLSRLLSQLLFGVSPSDASAAAAALLLAIVALAACCVPALRATRVSPIEALRSE